METQYRIPGNLEYSEFIEYLVIRAARGEEDDCLPSMVKLSKELGISQGKLREQLEVAKAFGLVEVNPKTGIRCLDYSFFPAVNESLMIALGMDTWKNFEAYSELRKKVEAGFWRQAVEQLEDEDLVALKVTLDIAWEKLRAQPIQIPHQEHRDLHMIMYRRLDNPFVLGILESYWQAYERVGLNVYTNFSYLEKVWNFHTVIVESICSGDYDTGFEALVDHMMMIFDLSESIS